MCPREIPPSFACRSSSVTFKTVSLTTCFGTNKVVHGIAARGSGRKPKRSRESAAGKDTALSRPVCENELLARTAKEHRVLTDDVPGPERGKADLALRTWSGGTPRRCIASRHGKSARLRGRAHERERGARGSVPLETVMELE